MSTSFARSAVGQHVLIALHGVSVDIAAVGEALDHLLKQEQILRDLLGLELDDPLPSIESDARVLESVGGRSGLAEILLSVRRWRSLNDRSAFSTETTRPVSPPETRTTPCVSSSPATDVRTTEPAAAPAEPMPPEEGPAVAPGAPVDARPVPLRECVLAQLAARSPQYPRELRAALRVSEVELRECLRDLEADGGVHLVGHATGRRVWLGPSENAAPPRPAAVATDRPAAAATTGTSAHLRAKEIDEQRRREVCALAVKAVQALGHQIQQLTLEGANYRGTCVCGAKVIVGRATHGWVHEGSALTRKCHKVGEREPRPSMPAMPLDSEAVVRRREANILTRLDDGDASFAQLLAELPWQDLDESLRQGMLNRRLRSLILRGEVLEVGHLYRRVVK